MKAQDFVAAFEQRCADNASKYLNGSLRERSTALFDLSRFICGKVKRVEKEVERQIQKNPHKIEELRALLEKFESYA